MLDFVEEESDELVCEPSMEMHVLESTLGALEEFGTKRPEQGFVLPPRTSSLGLGRRSTDLDRQLRAPKRLSDRRFSRTLGEESRGLSPIREGNKVSYDIGIIKPEDKSDALVMLKVEREEHPDDLEIKLAIPLPETAEHHSGHLIINVQSLTSKKILAVYSSSHAIRLRIEDDKALVSLDAGRGNEMLHLTIIPSTESAQDKAIFEELYEKISDIRPHSPPPALAEPEPTPVEEPEPVIREPSPEPAPSMISCTTQSGSSFLFSDSEHEDDDTDDRWENESDISEEYFYRSSTACSSNRFELGCPRTPTREVKLKHKNLQLWMGLPGCASSSAECLPENLADEVYGSNIPVTGRIKTVSWLFDDGDLTEVETPLTPDIFPTKLTMAGYGTGILRPQPVHLRKLPAKVLDYGSDTESESSWDPFGVPRNKGSSRGSWHSGRKVSDSPSSKSGGTSLRKIQSAVEMRTKMEMRPKLARKYSSTSSDTFWWNE